MSSDTVLKVQTASSLQGTKHQGKIIIKKTQKMVTNIPMATQWDLSAQNCMRRTKDNAHLELRCARVSSYNTVTIFKLSFWTTNTVQCSAVRGKQRSMEKYLNNNNNNNNWDQPLTNQNSIQEEIKNRLKSGNAYHSVQNRFSSSFLSKNMQIKMCRL